MLRKIIDFAQKVCSEEIATRQVPLVGCQECKDSIVLFSLPSPFRDGGQLLRTYDSFDFHCKEGSYLRL